MRGTRKTIWQRAHGFSLIEVLVVVSVIALLATIAYPAYQDQIRKTHRSQAKAALADAVARQEQFFLNNKTYTQNLDASGLHIASTTEGGFYVIQVAAPTGACPIDRCYQIEAQPQASQTADVCGTLTVTSQGTRTPAGCWP
jgi:type IV pilus assembly protein PilE